MPVAMITGASQGIGKATAERLLEEGFSLVLCARNGEELGALASDWSLRFPEAEILTLAADMEIPEQREAFVQLGLDHFPKIDLLVNNAGIFIPGKLMEEPEGHLEKTLQLNLIAPYALCRLLFPRFKEQGEGHIVNLCSVASLQAYPSGGAYSISKYALLGFTDNLRLELQPYGIRVTALCPGATYSRSWEGTGADPERMMEARDVAEMIYSSWALSPKANVDQIVMRPIKGDLD